MRVRIPPNTCFPIAKCIREVQSLRAWIHLSRLESWKLVRQFAKVDPRSGSFELFDGVPQGMQQLSTDSRLALRKRQAVDANNLIAYASVPLCPLAVAPLRCSQSARLRLSLSTYVNASIHRSTYLGVYISTQVSIRFLSISVSIVLCLGVSMYLGMLHRCSYSYVSMSTYLCSCSYVLLSFICIYVQWLGRWVAR